MARRGLTNLILFSILLLGCGKKTTIYNEEVNVTEKEILVMTEFEVKFRVDITKLHPFKNIMTNKAGLKNFIYVESDDVYFVNKDEFLRFRFDPNKKEKRKELTYKKRLNDKDNIQRIEVNLRVDPTDYDTAEYFCNVLGYQENFRIQKMCHIYNFEDATLVFYTVKDGSKLDHFMEIEVREDMEFTEDQAWAIIRKWEKELEPLGITAQNRLRKSLFDMYRRE